MSSKHKSQDKGRSPTHGKGKHSQSFRPFECPDNQPGCGFYDADNIHEQWPDLEHVPRPEPHPAYERDHDQWETEYDAWKDLKCPSGKGFFCKAHGMWVSCMEVENGLGRKGKRGGDKCPSRHDGTQPWTEPSEDPRHTVLADQPYTGHGYSDSGYTDTVYAGHSYPSQSYTDEPYDQHGQDDELALGIGRLDLSSHADPEASEIPKSSGFAAGSASKSNQPNSSPAAVFEDDHGAAHDPAFSNAYEDQYGDAYGSPQSKSYDLGYGDDYGSYEDDTGKAGLQHQYPHHPPEGDWQPLHSDAGSSTVQKGKSKGAKKRHR